MPAAARPASTIEQRRSSWAIVGMAALVGLLFALLPIGTAIDRTLGAARFALVPHSASGKVVVVEMDAQSARTIKRWPWSRSHYAKVIDRLRQAGATTIVFDVDFSSSADAAGDTAFADALKRATGLVALPTFGQSANSTDQRTIDALPLPMFRTPVALASVSIQPDSDGQVRAMPFGTITAGVPRPSLSAYIAQRSGPVNVGFPIDMSIDPSTIPRLSFVAVRDGMFDPSHVRGRTILVGATAVEMGDRYATPLWGVIPGVVVQAMAAETLLRGIPIDGGTTMPFLLAFAIGAGIVRTRGAALVAAVGGALVLAFVAALLAQHALLVTYPLATPLVMIGFTGCACGIREVAGRFRTQRLVDAATGLPNGVSLIAEQHAAAACTLVVVQLVNYDSLVAVIGSRASADVLLRVADRLALVASEGRVYRTADRQLAFVLPQDEPVDDTLDGLRSILLQAVEVLGRKVDVAVALGVATRGMMEVAVGIERLLADAGLAAEHALQSGSFWRGSVADDDDLERSISLMGELDTALVDGGIEVFYQPKYDLRSAQIISTEALVRWRHVTRGFIGPDLFIPLAEKTNRIAPLTLHVLQTVVRDLSQWRMQHGKVTAAINISANLLSDSAFNAAVERILLASKVPTAALVFEVTESAAMSDPISAIAALERYRDLGIALSMDDYGTGQSTLTYLKQLPLNELKIDRSFVQHAHINRADGVLVRSTINLAHDLGLKVVAEGVEDRACLDFLKTCNCDVIQGYYISRPLALPQLLTLLADPSTLAA